MTTFADIILSLDTVHKLLSDARYDDTTASECAALTEAARLVLHASELVVSVANSATRQKGPAS